MRKDYHIIGPSSERDLMYRTIDNMGLEIGFCCTMNDQEYEMSHSEYIIHLSDDELLRLRLSCQIRAVIDTTKV